MTRMEIAEDLISQVAALFQHMPKNESTQELWSRICDFCKERKMDKPTDTEDQMVSIEAVRAAALSAFKGGHYEIVDDILARLTKPERKLRADCPVMYERLGISGLTAWFSDVPKSATNIRALIPVDLVTKKARERDDYVREFGERKFSDERYWQVMVDAYLYGDIEEGAE